MENIVFEKIEDNYYYGRYSNFTVIVMKYCLHNNSDKLCYINGSNLCSMVDKKFNGWSRKKSTKELITYLTEIDDVDKPIITINDGNNELRGSYVHPKLIPHVAIWCSVEFALKVSDIINNFVSTESRKEIRKLKNENEEKDEIIYNLKDKIEDLIMETRKSYNNLSKDNKKLHKKADKLHEKTDKLQETIDNICVTRVIRTGKIKDDTCLFIIKKNNDDYYQYKVFRRNIESMGSAFRECERDYPDHKIVLDLTYEPNSVISWKNVKNEIYDDVEFSKGTSSFNLNDGYTEKDLIKDVKKVSRRKYKT